ncbi:MAG: hypothetical protein LBQ88_02170 [Treponema sp.]|jgi:hypothetical protein|nr:hypothetical protein [Treponema sp.]
MMNKDIYFFSRIMRTFVLPLLLLFIPLQKGGAEEKGIITNAQGGIFREDQKFWFSVPQGNSLRLVLGNTEIYRGPGSFSLELKVLPGEEKEFIIMAERLGSLPYQRILETRFYSVYLDKKPPRPPRLNFTVPDEGGISGDAEVLQIEEEAGTALYAYVDYGAEPELITGSEEIKALIKKFLNDYAAGRGKITLSALVWSGDNAGNYSIPRAEFFEYPSVRIENPAAGIWENPQRLVLSGTEGKEIFWTSDGSDPAGPGAAVYQRNELINQTGGVRLRILIRYPNGHTEEKTLDYEVKEGDGGLPASAALRQAEAESVITEKDIPLPPDCLWAIGGTPSIREDVLTLRPSPGVRRMVPLHIAAGDGVYRFAFTLDGGPPSVLPGNYSPDSGGGSTSESFTDLQTEGGASVQDRPRILRAGRSRVLVWPGNRGAIRYALEQYETWLDGDTPLCIPPAGGSLRWISSLDDPQKESSVLVIEALNTDKMPAGAITGHLVCRKFPPNKNGTQMTADGKESGAGQWEFSTDAVSFLDLPDLSLFDVCDGEDMEWAFIQNDGTILAQRRIDRLAPAIPVLNVPGEGVWVRGPLRISGQTTGDGEETLYITAGIRYESGKTEQFSGTGNLLLNSTETEIGEVHLEAWTADSAGNRSPLTARNFFLDPLSIYVSSVHSPVSNDNLALGSRDRPFTSIDEALDFAKRETRNSLRLTGNFRLEKDIAIGRDIVIEGCYNSSWERGDYKTGIVFSSGIGIQFSGAAVSLTGFVLERPDDGDVFFKLEKGADLSISECTVKHSGSFLSAGEGSVCRIEDSRILSSIKGEGRRPAITVRNGSVLLKSADIELNGIYCLLFDIQGGAVEAGNCRFRVDSQRTAALALARNTRLRFEETSVSVSARDYSGGIETADSVLDIIGGSISVSAGDVTALIVSGGETTLNGTGITVKSSFLACALEFRDTSPRVTGCRFSFTGSARRSEVFTGKSLTLGDSRPMPLGAGMVGGNAFISFTHLLGDTYTREGIQGFNRAFAPPDKPNTWNDSVNR